MVSASMASTPNPFGDAGDVESNLGPKFLTVMDALWGKVGPMRRLSMTHPGMTGSSGETSPVGLPSLERTNLISM